ncbi:hypothetical protein WME89_15160 [Sorangium sp. So ce321]|uniref:hypothetical protein n=1 Tax=Sorangium sp. So ce321 TaxID=3133300 RepID=UPI003F636D2C
MSDPYIYQRDIEVYGRFTASQIQKLVVPIDAGFKQALRAVAARLDAATDALRKATLKATAAAVASSASGAAREGQADPVAAGRDLLRRLVEHAASRPGGVALARDLLQGQTLTTVLRRRPAKLAAAMAHALEVIEQHRRQLPDHEAWAAEIERARDALEPLTRSVRKSRLARRTMTPEVKAARDEWLNIYGAAKLLVECVLRLHGKVSLMPEIFDDLPRATRAAIAPINPAPRSPADVIAPP